MSDSEGQVRETQHAFLVVWGWFAEKIGLIKDLQDVDLHQKRYKHPPQAKVLEFLVAILAGLEHLQDISRSAHPLDQDQAVAEAWGQESWADYTGVSRTLRALSWAEAQALAQALEQVEQPLLEAELQVLRTHQQRVRYDGDLTGLPVSNSSRTYPNAAFGYMDDEIRLGYQAAVVSLVSPNYGRLWLAAAHHPGDTVSSSQAEALVLAAEARTGLRPRRRTELLRQRIAAFERQMAPTQQRLSVQEQNVPKARAHLAEATQTVREREAVVAEVEEQYRLGGRPERPHSRLAQARQRLQAAQRRQRRCEQALQMAEQRLAQTQSLRQAQQEALQALRERLARFEQDNATNSAPVEAEFRLDAGFGTYDNLALLIEMGYEVYTKAHNYRMLASLKTKAAQASWIRVGANAEMTAWPSLSLQHCPYPVDVGLERFDTGGKRQHSALLHFGRDPVTTDLPAWFAHYNGRQIIEAGIKEGKHVFYLHRIKVRSEPAIYLQERMVLFAANFIRWATRQLADQVEPSAESLDIRQLGVKRQVQVGAHTSAQVVWDSRGRLLRFSEASVFAGKVIRWPHGTHCQLPAGKSSHSGPFSSESHLIAQPFG